MTKPKSYGTSSFGDPSDELSSVGSNTMDLTNLSLNLKGSEISSYYTNSETSSISVDEEITMKSSELKKDLSVCKGRLVLKWLLTSRKSEAHWTVSKVIILKPSDASSSAI